MTDAGAAERVLIVVATRQGVANIPPILSYGRPATDRILWLESGLARDKDFAETSIALLRARGFDRHERLEVSDTPTEIAEALAGWLSAHREVRPILVGNGGAKLSGLGVAEALASRDHAIIYGDGEPCRLWVKESPAEPWARRPFAAAARLGLPEVLALNRHAIDNPADARRFWPDEAIWEEDYAVDVETTIAAHEEAELWTVGKRILERRQSLFREAAILCPEEMESWREQLVLLGRQVKNRLRHDADPDLAGLDVAAVFDFAVNLSRESIARMAGAKRKPIGARLERAVARRVRAWLAAHPDAPVSEGWETVRIRRANEASALVVADLDVALVLHNGGLLHLECKTCEAYAKDLSARLLNLRAVGSDLARMYVCAPVYTGYSTASWFRGVEDLRAMLKDREMAFVGFTLPDQPEFYQDRAGERRDCPSFEDALAAILRPFS